MVGRNFDILTVLAAAIFVRVARSGA
jgi:hypothetical protein